MSGLSLRFVPVGERLPGSAPGRFDEPLLNAFLDFLAGRSRPNSVLAATYDLKVWVLLLKCFNRFQNTFRVPVSGIHANKINTYFHQSGYAFIHIR